MTESGTPGTQTSPMTPVTPALVREPMVPEFMANAAPQPARSVKAPDSSVHLASAPVAPRQANKPAVLTWSVLPAGPLPRTRCCATGCTRCTRKSPATWQPLPFESEEERAPASDPLSPRAAHTDEHIIATTLIRLCAEICWGLRSPHQSIRWTTRSAYDYLCRRHVRARAIGAGHALAGTVTITGVRAQIISDRVMECNGVVLSRSERGVTARALAVRATVRADSWWVTDVEL